MCFLLLYFPFSVYFYYFKKEFRFIFSLDSGAEECMSLTLQVLPIPLTNSVGSFANMKSIDHGIEVKVEGPLFYVHPTSVVFISIIYMF